MKSVLALTLVFLGCHEWVPTTPQTIDLYRSKLRVTTDDGARVELERVEIQEDSLVGTWVSGSSGDRTIASCDTPHPTNNDAFVCSLMSGKFVRVDHWHVATIEGRTVSSVGGFGIALLVLGGIIVGSLPIVAWLVILR